MNNQEKIISKNTEFILYGAGEVGNICYKNLSEKGYRVIAALDKSKSGSHVIEGIYTYRLGDESALSNKSDHIVVICLADGMIHREAADQLYKAGFPYLVFLPLDYSISDLEKRRLTRLYNQVLTADTEMLSGVVSPYSDYLLPDMEISGGGGILCRSAQNVTVWLNLEMLFSESIELWKGDKSKIHMKRSYKDRNIACAHPYEDLFYYYSMKTDSYDSYFDSRKEKAEQEDKEKELRKKEKLYRLFKREYMKGMDFFIEAAPEVVWNPKNYFNLVGGHHRTLYLLHEGHSLFPVKMQYEDFNKWHNEEVCHEVKRYVIEHKIEKFYAPLPNPCFLNFPVKWEDTGNTKLAAVLRYFSSYDMRNMTVLDYSDDEGYFARNMSRLGARETFFRSNDIRQTELANLFNRLLYRNEVIIQLDENADTIPDVRYDIVFAMGDNAAGVKNMIESKLQILQTVCKRYLVMETISHGQVEEICKEMGVKEYTAIHKEYKEGDIWELGVYCR